MTRLALEYLEGVPVARPRGDIDAANASRINEELADCLAGGSDRIVLDLSETRYLDSAAIDVLFRLHERLRQRRARLLVVIPPSSQLIRLAELVGLTTSLAVYESVQQALARAPAVGDGSRGGEAREGTPTPDDRAHEAQAAPPVAEPPTS
jgi:anti-anti-sigma factor